MGNSFPRLSDVEMEWWNITNHLSYMRNKTVRALFFFIRLTQQWPVKKSHYLAYTCKSYPRNTLQYPSSVWHWRCSYTVFKIEEFMHSVLWPMLQRGKCNWACKCKFQITLKCNVDDKIMYFYTTDIMLIPYYICMIFPLLYQISRGNIILLSNFFWW